MLTLYIIEETFSISYFLTFQSPKDLPRSEAQSILTKLKICQLWEPLIVVEFKNYSYHAELLFDLVLETQLLTGFGKRR